MELYQKIVAARKKKGLTQEQLAELANVTVRTIQRIENQESMPRSYTLKTIATVLEISFEELTAAPDTGAETVVGEPVTAAGYNPDDGKHLLQLICLSCFSYLVVPVVHWLIPGYLLKKSKEQNPAIIAFARAVIRGQLYWMAALWFLLLITLAYNLTSAAYFQRSHTIHYLVPFFIMYLLNAVQITMQLVRANKTDFSESRPITS